MHSKGCPRRAHAARDTDGCICVCADSIKVFKFDSLLMLLACRLDVACDFGRDGYRTYTCDLCLRTVFRARPASVSDIYKY